MFGSLVFAITVALVEGSGTVTEGITVFVVLISDVTRTGVVEATELLLARAGAST